MGEHDFSEDFDTQRQKEAELAGSAVLLTAVAVPSIILTWPFAAMCGGVTAVGEYSDARSGPMGLKSVNCYELLRDITEETYNLLVNKSDEPTIKYLDDAHSLFIVSKIDEEMDDRRIIKTAWGCRSGSFYESDDVEAFIGLKSGRIVWANLKSRW